MQPLHQPLHRRPGDTDAPGSRRKVSSFSAARSPTLSPSILGTTEPAAVNAVNAVASLPPPAPLQQAARGKDGKDGRAPSPTPNGPAPRVSADSSDALLSESASIGADEEYGEDERQLNEFLRLHPMCSLYVPTNRTHSCAVTRACLL